MKDLLIQPAVSESGMVSALQPTIDTLWDIVEIGRKASKGVKRVVLVSCGGGKHMFLDNLLPWCRSVGENLFYEVLSSDQLLSEQPRYLDRGETLVVLSSKSGTTPTTNLVGEWLTTKRCKLVVVTESATTGLAQYGDFQVYTQPTTQGFHATLMVKKALLGGILAEREGYAHLRDLLAALAAEPALLAAAARAHQPWASGFVRRQDRAGTTYLIGSGMADFVGKAFGLCCMEEMIGAKVNAYAGDHVFHSFVELYPFLAAGDRVIFLRGLDNSTWQVDYDTAHCDRIGFPYELLDAREFMGTTPPSVRGLQAPIILEAMLKPLALPMADLFGKDLDQRSAMSVVDLHPDLKRVMAEIGVAL